MDAARHAEMLANRVRKAFHRLQPVFERRTIGAFRLYDRAGVDPQQYALYAGHPYFHLGHGLGLNSSELPLIRLTDRTVIEPGMVFSIEAYVRGPDMQYGSEEDVLITASGCEVLSEPDTGLSVID